MTIAAPRICLGLWIPNSTLSVPDTGTGAAGWTSEVAGLSLIGIDGMEDYGHPRAQRLSYASGASTKRYAAPYTPIGQCVANVSTSFFYAVEWKAPASSPGTGSWRLLHRILDSTGTVLATSTPIGATSTTPSTWTLATATASVTPPSNAAYHQLVIQLDNTSLMSRDFRFVGFGTWFATHSYTLSFMPTHPGTSVRRSGMREELRDSQGGRRFINGQNRFAQSWHIDLACAIMDDTQHKALDLAHAYNMGRTYQSPDIANPGGGQFPLLIETNHSGMPKVGYYDFDSIEAPWNVGTGVYWDPPYWAGTAGLTERIL